MSGKDTIKYQWRVTRYDPSKRNKNGAYLPDEWYQWEHIGETFNGKKLTIGEYFASEDKYAQAALSFFLAANINDLVIKDFSLRPPSPRAVRLGLGEQLMLHDGQTITEKEIAQTIRMLLRETASGRLISPHKFFIDIGYDYYMYIGCNSHLGKAIAYAESIGLYVENMKSPYHFED